MKKHDLKLLGGKYSYKNPIAIINKYYNDNPQFILYDVPLNNFKMKVNKYRGIISKASVLGLKRIDSKRWVKSEKKLREEQYEIILTLFKKKNNIGYYATITKILHLLFPEIVPIIDKKVKKAVKQSKMYSFYHNVLKNELISIILVILNDVEKNKTRLKKICKSINNCNEVNITPLRAWDILIWSKR